MVSTSLGCRKLQMRFTKVKWSFACLFLYHVKEVEDFSSYLKYLSCCAWTRGALCRALRGTWIWKVLFLLGSSSCSAARPVSCLRGREAAQAVHHQIESMVSIKVANQQWDFRSRESALKYYAKDFFLLGEFGILQFSFHWCPALPGPWWAGQNPRENKEGISVFTKNEYRCILKT